MRHLLQRNSAIRRLHYRLKLRMARSQSDELEIIDRLAVDIPKTFIEFGFHPIEFNCIALARRPEWAGMLIDGNAEQVEDVRQLFPSVEAVQRFLTLDNLAFIKTTFPKLGILSIDVDGNDYWFLQELISIRPALICVEYNASFGLEPITVPYDPAFDRMTRHPRAWYHGASLTALASLCAAHGYGLAAVSRAGLNAFFTRTGSLDPVEAWLPNAMRERFSKVPHNAQWDSLKDFPFVRV